MRSLVPVLEPQFAQRGLFEPGAADIDVNALHQGFIRGLKQRGSRVECGVQIHSIERAGEEWLLEVAMRGGQPHSLRAPLLINAAGAWADEVAALAGVAPLGHRAAAPIGISVPAARGRRTAHWPFVTSVAEDFYFKPDAGLLLGSPANADPVLAARRAAGRARHRAGDRSHRASHDDADRTAHAALGRPAFLRCRRRARGRFRSRRREDFSGSPRSAATEFRRVRRWAKPAHTSR